MEQPSGVDSSRLDARFVGWLSPTRIGTGPFFAPGIRTLLNLWHGTGRSCVAGFRLGIGKQFSKHAAVELVYGDRTAWEVHPSIR